MGLLFGSELEAPLTIEWEPVVVLLLLFVEQQQVFLSIENALKLTFIKLMNVCMVIWDAC